MSALMTMGSELSEGVSMVTCLSLAISYPSVAAAPYMFINGYKNLLAIALQTHYSFPLANKYLLHQRINKLDMISELTDDILLHVLSFLTLKEAGKTTVLSKRWRHICAYIPNLNFDSRVVLDEFVQLKLNDTSKSLHKAMQVQGPKYINWVDQVVSSHKASTIDEFRVRFEVLLFRNSTEIVDNWFRFAMEKRVKKLEVDLSHSLFPIQDYYIRPTFPSLSLCNSLTFLELGCVNIQGEILESFLCNCRALEHLSVKYSKSLVHLKVSGPSLNLKHLIIYKCYEIEHLEIYAPNLESVCYSGPEINVQFKSAPKLARVTFGSSYADDLMNICSDLSNCLSQITELTLDSDDALECPNLSLEESVIFTKLEKLDVMVFLSTEDDLYCFIPLIKACPLLKHFKLRRRPYDLYDYIYYPKREQREWETTRLYNLKIVEIVGFVGHALDLTYNIVGYLGHAVDIELAAYLDKSAVSLDKIIADTRDPCTHRFENKWRRKEARKWAEELRAKLKPSTELEII